MKLARGHAPPPGRLTPRGRRRPLLLPLSERYSSLLHLVSSRYGAGILLGYDQNALDRPRRRRCARLLVGYGDWQFRCERNADAACRADGSACSPGRALPSRRARALQGQRSAEGCAGGRESPRCLRRHARRPGEPLRHGARPCRRLCWEPRCAQDPAVAGLFVGEDGLAVLPSDRCSCDLRHDLGNDRITILYQRMQRGQALRGLVIAR